MIIIPAELSATTSWIVLGAQWGDEAKGKLVYDFIRYYRKTRPHVKVVCVRFNGGANAGHSIYIDGKLYDTHLLPSGIMDPEVLNVIGNGELVYLMSLFDEIAKFKGMGISCENLVISNRTHCTFMIQGLADAILNFKMGTTKKGIAQTASDRSLRRGIRMDDFVNSCGKRIDNWKQKLESLYEEYENELKLKLFSIMYPKNMTSIQLKEYHKELFGISPIEKFPEITSSLPIDYYAFYPEDLGQSHQHDYFGHSETEIRKSRHLQLLLDGLPIRFNFTFPTKQTFLNVKDMLNFELNFITRNLDLFVPKICDVGELLQNLSSDTQVVFEGANSIMLDPDYGTYPFVTSTVCTTAGVLLGTGVSARWLERRNYKVINVTKGNITRVGTGALPTWDISEQGETMQVVGKEFGVTTKRKRRCGWIDLPQLKYVIDLCGTDFINLTKLDVLGEFDELKICVAYVNKIDESPVLVYPTNEHELANVKPIYETFEGWKGFDFASCEKYEDLHENVKQYIAYIEQFLGVKVLFVNTGPNEGQMVTKF